MFHKVRIVVSEVRIQEVFRRLEMQIGTCDTFIDLLGLSQHFVGS